MADIAEDDPAYADHLADLSAEAPIPNPAYEWIWRAWHRLSASRPHVSIGMSHPMGATIIAAKPLPIPWEVVMQWAAWHSLDDDERELLDVCVQAMDRVLDEIWTERNKVKA